MGMGPREEMTATDLGLDTDLKSNNGSRPSWVPEVQQAADGVANEVVRWRREIHANPELGLQNPKTQALICSALSNIGLEPILGSKLSSVVAEINPEASGPTILLRADTDALPMVEESGEDFASQFPDAAHMCGHDAHVAMLLGASKVLFDLRDSLRGRVVLAFQPGEEGSGGAAVMIEEGLLNSNPDFAFALHITPNLPVGMAATRVGALLASTDEFSITVRGAGGHASQPHQALDPVPIACEIVTSIQSMVARRIHVFEPAIVSVSSLHAGTTYNVIPEVATLRGTIRTVNESTRVRVKELLARLVKGVAEAHGCTADFDFSAGYPVTVNDADATGLMVSGMHDVGIQCVELPWPTMGGEDFSYILSAVPGAMTFLGVCPADVAHPLTAPSCHSNKMRLNEDALLLGVSLLAASTYRGLEAAR